MLTKIVSGGQTGVDRAALDWALSRGIPHGGWCPKGRRAMDGAIPPIYQLQETPSRDYRQRTEWNVRDSDATLIINIGELDGGTKLTVNVAARMAKPHLTVQADTTSVKEAIQKVAAWLYEGGFETLNVAGPRQENRPGVYDTAKHILDEVALLLHR